MSLYVGIDLGTSATKVLVLDADGRVRAKTRAPYPILHPRVGWSEQDPDAWWAAVCDATSRALVDAGCGPVAGAALSGQLNGLVMVDENGRPLGPAPIWLDLRATEEAAWLNERHGARIEAATLNRANPIYVGAKLLWLARHRPDWLRRGRHLLLAKDYVNLRLTGTAGTDTSDASCTLLYDLRSDAWMADLVREIGAEPSLLPPLYRSTDVLGTVTAAAAARTGLPEGTPVAAGAGDVTALSVGSGAVDDDVVSVTLGTAGHVVIASDRLAPEGANRIWQMRHALPDRFVRLGLVMSGGLSLSWFEREFGEAERTAARAGGPDAFERLLARTTASHPGARGALFLPFLEGAATPYQAPDLKAAFVDVASAHTKADLLQAVLEGVAYNVRDCVALFEDLGSVVHEVRLSEGGSRSDGWCQIVADVLERPVRTLRELDASALGAAMIAMASAEKRDLREVVSAVVATQTDRSFEPRPQFADVYREAYGRYRATASALLRRGPPRVSPPEA